jgi:hypothetical protein
MRFTVPGGQYLSMLSIADYSVAFGSAVAQVSGMRASLEAGVAQATQTLADQQSQVSTKAWCLIPSEMCSFSYIRSFSSLVGAPPCGIA